MRLSQYILPTQKEDPSDAQVSSHRLMIRAGLIRKEAAGMYAYLPAGLRALRKISAIVKDEMDKAGAMECLMPELTTADLWKESGRWDSMGPEMFRIRDRNSMEYALGPTHEEAFTALVRSVVSSYKDLPVNVYQINTKFRDEIRPRFGVIRSKEFIMKDAYSFDIDQGGLDESYQKMAAAYRAIFDRCGLETIPVQADSGTMGGSASEEFMVASEVGEETLLLCEKCGYRANQEKAEFKRSSSEFGEKSALTEVNTPAIKTIDDLAEFFSCDGKLFLKTIVFVADGEPVVAVVTGDRDINEAKLKNYLQATDIEQADDETVVAVTKSSVGFAGPVRSEAPRIIFDSAVANIHGAITGANKTDYHFTGVEPGRDFVIEEEADLVEAVEGDLCPDCGEPMITRKGIEVGHIFKLGKKYTESMKVSVLDNNGKAVVPLMGCYGIGVTRTLAAVIEQHHDDSGLTWPASVAPFDVHLVGIGKGDEEKAAIDEVYNSLISEGLDVLYDDRKLSPGVKFADADLLGVPVRITCGKSYFADGELEIKIRKTGEQSAVKPDNLSKKIREILADHN
ncbi:MAG: proline--tRNA ligase [Spirochaetes bacterium]|jgi:prolyl-tRNA synthetase|nr:proline--tRNA ligase [Spirochaetota bacterium]